MTSKLYEVRIHEPAVSDGLFPRPERYRYMNMWQFEEDQGVIKRLRMGEIRAHFVDGKGEIYDCVTAKHIPAEIVGVIDHDRAMEADRFEDLTNEH
jgi:hypothetical protein